MDLFDFIDENDGAVGPVTIRQRFERFHAAHPDVLAKLIELAMLVKRQGKRCGIRLLWERLRWHYFIERDASEEFKFNDHYHSHYARLVMATCPELEGFFELRRIRDES